MPVSARKEVKRVSGLEEIKRRLERVSELSGRMKEQFSRLSGPEGEEMKKRLREQGARVGIGAGISLFGLAVTGVAFVYLMAVVILLVNIALDRLWLSALIVVGGFIVIGAVIIAVGAALAKASARELSKAKEEVARQLRETAEEMKKEVAELQAVARREAEEQQRRFNEMVQAARENAHVIAPAAAGAFLVLRLIKRAANRRRKRKAIRNIIELVEEAYAEREHPD